MLSVNSMLEMGFKSVGVGRKMASEDHSVLGCVLSGLKVHIPEHCVLVGKYSYLLIQFPCKVKVTSQEIKGEIRECQAKNMSFSIRIRGCFVCRRVVLYTLR